MDLLTLRWVDGSLARSLWLLDSVLVKYALHFTGQAKVFMRESIAKKF